MEVLAKVFAKPGFQPLQVNRVNRGVLANVKGQLQDRLFMVAGRLTDDLYEAIYVAEYGARPAQPVTAASRMFIVLFARVVNDNDRAPVVLNPMIDDAHNCPHVLRRVLIAQMEFSERVEYQYVGLDLFNLQGDCHPALFRIETQPHVAGLDVKAVVVRLGEHGREALAQSLSADFLFNIKYRYLFMYGQYRLPRLILSMEQMTAFRQIKRHVHYNIAFIRLRLTADNHFTFDGKKSATDDVRDGRFVGLHKVGKQLGHIHRGYHVSLGLTRKLRERRLS